MNPLGRKVTTVWGKVGAIGEIVRWEPLGSGMCDTFVHWEDGSECWYSMSDLRPADGKGPLSNRQDAREVADSQALRSLKAIREQHVKDFHRPWPGLEYGKAILGKSIDGAIQEVEKHLKK